MVSWCRRCGAGHAGAGGRRSLGRRGRPVPSDPEHLPALLDRVARATGHDFSSYKRSMVLRRVARRLELHRLGTLEAYVALLAERPEEVRELFRDLLIGVTWFFRDPGAFDALAAAIDDMLLRRPGDAPLRIWVPACATGEEAFSVAIVAHECLERAGRTLPVQVFATDLDADAIRVARTATWPMSAASRVGPERFARWFTVDGEVFRAVPALRDGVVFGTQNLVGEAPFHRLDLLSCRNLLIYLDTDEQRRLLALFHYALQPWGLLFLGTSEAVDDSSDLFEPVDGPWRVYRNRGTANDASALLHPQAWQASLPHPIGQGGSKARYDEVLLQELVPPTVVIEERGDILFVHGRTGRFLEPIEGLQRPHNLFEMAREGLPAMLQALVREASEAPGRDVIQDGVRVAGDDGESAVDLRVRQVQSQELGSRLFLVTFASARAVPPPTEGVDGRLLELGREVQRTRREHHVAMVDLARANEELRCTNDDLQCANEELQTSREEMRALNDELQALNGLLRDKLAELSRSQEMAGDLLEATGLPLVFLDAELRVARFTEAATKLFRLRSADLGRPLTDLTSSLRHPQLADDLQRAVRTQQRIVRHVEAEGGCAWIARITPSSTLGGLAITYQPADPVEAA
ncbi:MAG: PAS domain-containing protein [Myxococcales bacterium]|nr:PAS domain-containing protein [Myxococcales bacterium]